MSESFVIAWLETLYQNQGVIIASLSRLEKQVATISTDITNLVAAVTSVTADIQVVLTDLAAQPNITPDQQTSLEAQIAALQTLDANVKAATPVAPTPTPAPTPAPTPTPTPAS
jgi:septal ring factor EnvC (AmiA/AmiB activator)